MAERKAAHRRIGSRRDMMTIRWIWLAICRCVLLAAGPSCAGRGRSKAAPPPSAIVPDLPLLPSPFERVDGVAFCRATGMIYHGHYCKAVGRKTGRQYQILCRPLNADRMIDYNARTTRTDFDCPWNYNCARQTPRRPSTPWQLGSTEPVPKIDCLPRKVTKWSSKPRLPHREDDDDDEESGRPSRPRKRRRKDNDSTLDSSTPNSAEPEVPADAEKHDDLAWADGLIVDPYDEQSAD